MFSQDFGRRNAPKLSLLNIEEGVLNNFQFEKGEERVDVDQILRFTDKKKKQCRLSFPCPMVMEERKKGT